jgi:sigma-B regulation protein RsbU (phosphoserine phosphatase)
MAGTSDKEGFEHKKQISVNDIVGDIEKFPPASGTKIKIGTRKAPAKETRENIEQLRIERDLFKEAISAVSHPFYAIDANNYKILMANPASRNLFGDLSAHPFCYSWTHGRNQPCAGADHPCPLEILKNTKQPLTLEHTHYDKQGRPRYFQIHAYPLLGPGGNVNIIIEYALEITELKKVVEVQRETEQRYREIIENAHDIIQSTRPDGTLAFVNQAWHDALGYTKDDLLSLNLFDIIHPDSLPQYREWFAKILAGQRVTEIPAALLAKNGRKIFLEGNVSPRMLDGKVISTHGIFRNVTARKQAEAALWESEKKYRSILESIEDGYYEVDILGNMTFFNDSLCQLLGYPENELRGINYRQLMDEEFSRKVFNTFNHVYRTGNPEKALDWQIKRKDGTTRWVEGSVSLISDEEGLAVGFHGIIRDVTERKSAEEKLARYSKHLEKIIAELNVAQEVQQNLLPHHPPTDRCFDIAGTSLYCDEIGGDYYDYIRLPWLGSRVYAVVVGDVSGHGVSSALLMAGVRAYLRSRVLLPGSVAEIITDVNRLVSADTLETGQFMTLFFLVFDTQTGLITWVRAGHHPAFFYSPFAGCCGELGGESLPLGVTGDWEYKAYRARAKPGEIFILTTDGVWEAQNGKGEMFGKKRFKKIIAEKASLGAEGILESIIAAVATFRGDAPQNDDITLVVIKYLK